MTLVKKNINGTEYLYIQDKVPNSERVITTYVGRADLIGDELFEAKSKASTTHMGELLEASGILNLPVYHFENTPKPLIGDEKFWELIRFSCEHMMKVVSSSDFQDLEKTIFIKYVQGTTAIEGNTFNERETERLLLNNLTTANKTVDETLEIANYNEAREFLKTYTGDVTENLIKRIHALLMRGLKTSSGRPIKGGEYRTTPVFIIGGSYTPPPPEQVSDHMEYALHEYYEGVKRKVHLVELAALFHLKFEQIHPFPDGNGRVGREVLNFMLNRSGYPQIYIPYSERSNYLSSLQTGDEGNSTPIVEFVLSRILGTAIFIMSRTTIFNELTSEEFGKFFAGILDEDTYKTFSEALRATRATRELP
jgi:fido (protein-threonine AMPylation protein)